jgi:hypothetical protein
LTKISSGEQNLTLADRGSLYLPWSPTSSRCSQRIGQQENRRYHRVRSLIGAFKGSTATKEDYRKHIAEKYR